MEQSGSNFSLRGTHPAKIDDKGRLKVPNAFRYLIEKAHGGEVFVTSLTGEDVLVYPMPEWIAIEQRLAQMASAHPSRARYLERSNYFGQTAEIDNQGRVIIHARLRESAGMLGEVDVLGKITHLDVWNHERFLAKLQREPYTEDDARALAQFGI